MKERSQGATFRATVFWDLSNHWTGVWTAAVEWNDHMEFYLQQKAPFYIVLG